MQVGIEIVAGLSQTVSSFLPAHFLLSGSLVDLAVQFIDLRVEFGFLAFDRRLQVIALGLQGFAGAVDGVFQVIAGIFGFCLVQALPVKRATATARAAKDRFCFMIERWF